MNTSIHGAMRAASVETVMWFLLCAAFASIAAAEEQPPDWKYSGTNKAESSSELLAAFYSAGEISRLPDGHIQVRTKSLGNDDLLRAFDSMSREQIDAIRKRIANSYVPPYALDHKLSEGALVWVVAQEELANSASIQPRKLGLIEFDCSKRLSRELGMHVASAESPGSSDETSEWRRTPPESSASSLLAQVCPRN
jgi:hypothetical protein